MTKDRAEELIVRLDKLKQTFSEKDVLKLELDKCKVLIKKLHSYSDRCDDCSTLFTDLETQIDLLSKLDRTLTSEDFKDHREVLVGIRAHLQKNHKLITEGYYSSIYMSIGMCAGLLIGAVVLDNLILWLVIGFVLGAAIGTSLDADAKKKGLVI